VRIYLISLYVFMVLGDYIQMAGALAVLQTRHFESGGVLNGP